METPKTNECPSPDRLRGLLSGELPASDQDAVTKHIEACASCQRTLDSWLSSPSVEGLAAAGKDSATQEFALRELMDHVKKKSIGAMTQAESEAVNPDDLVYLKPSNKPGTLGRLHHYDILQILGKGGFGTVFKAFDTKLQRMVAIKVLAPELAANGSARKRFIREAQAAAAIKNEHVVAIYNVEDEHQPPYIAMEIIDGISLQDRVDRAGSLELKEILRIGMQIAEGLASAHKQGLIHRDIKPANILLENGVQRVKITDFGLARLTDDASISQSGLIAGTPMYMAPEQAQGEQLDQRADLFSLGSVLYTLSAGHPPFRANSTMAVLKRVCEETPRPIREINPELPDWLSDIVTKLHAKKAEDRYQTARAIADLLGEKLAELQFTGRANAGRAEGRNAPVETPATESINRPLTRHGSPKRVLFAFVIASVMGIAAFLAVVYWPRNTDAPEKKNPIAKKEPPVILPVEPGWVQLFNGKDLTGWKVEETYPGDWQVDANGLTCSTKKLAYLFSTQAYGDFHLRLEAKASSRANLGLIFRNWRGHWHNGEPRGYVFNPLDGGLWLQHMSQERFALGKKPVFEPDRWFTIEIIARQKHIRVMVDGKQVAEAVNKGDDPATGCVGLRAAGITGEFHVRNIEIKELPATAAEPFFILTKAGRPETRHPTLAAAVAVAQSGDTIEVQGNGPYVVDEAIEIDNKPLTIRAATSSSPSIRRTILEGNKRGHDYLFITRAPIVLEGFEFQLNNLTTDRYLSVLLSHNAKVRIANCQVAGKGAGSLLVTQNGVGAEIRNCFTLFESNTSVTIDGRVGENNTQVSIQNGIFYGGNATFGVHYPREPKSSHRVEVASSTILPNRLAQVRFDKLPKSRAENPTLVELSVRENIVKAVRVVRVESRDSDGAFGRNETERIQKDHLRLTDKGNLFASSHFLDYWKADPKTWAGKAVAEAQKVVTLPEWNELWQLRDTGSVIGEPRFVGTDLANRMNADPYKLQPADFRLAKGSPGQGVLPGGKDLGADVDLVGPGEAYERWKKTPAYQEWRKQTDALMSQ